jgi:hypothetical protein
MMTGRKKLRIHASRSESVIPRIHHRRPNLVNSGFSWFIMSCNLYVILQEKLH